MSRWWRAYDEALHDPKLIALSDKLHRAWFNLLCVASKNAGVLPAINLVAIELRVSTHKAAEYITALVAAGLIDEVETGKFVPHNWKGRQFQSDVSTDRVKRFRERERNVSSAVSETPPETEAETEAETDKENSSLRSPPVRSSDDETQREFDAFYQQFPRHEGRGHALKAYRGARKTVDSAKLLEGAIRARERYRDSDPKFIPLPATWLHGQRWLDEVTPEKSARAEEFKKKIAEYDEFYRGVL